MGTKTIQCPECGSERVWKDGLRRFSSGGTVQRYICRSCGLRFSESTANNRVKVNIFRQTFKESNSRKGLSETNIFQSDPSFQPVAEDLSFQISEYITPQSPSTVTITEKNINIFPYYSKERRVGASSVRGVKNSASQRLVKMENVAEAKKQAAGAATKLSEADVKGKLLEFAWRMKKQGYANETIRCYTSALKVLVERGADINSPESVKEVIARQN